MCCTKGIWKLFIYELTSVYVLYIPKLYAHIPMQNYNIIMKKSLSQEIIYSWITSDYILYIPKFHAHNPI